MSTLEQEAADRVQESTRGTCSVELQRPEVATEALVGLAEGKSQYQVSRETGVTRGTLKRMGEDHAEWLAKVRKERLYAVAERARKAGEVADRKLDELMSQESLEKVPLRELSVAEAIYLDKMERLAGTPDVRVQVDAGPGLSECLEAIREARVASGVVMEAEVVEGPESGAEGP